VQTKIQESTAGRVAAWAALTASFGLSFATWMALAVLAGFDQRVTVPVFGWRVAVAVLMPVAVDGYVVTALALWMADVPDDIASFARQNTYAAAATGVAAQAAYHGANIWSATDSPWQATLATIVGAIPPLFAALSVHMRAKIRRHALLALAAIATDTAADTPLAPVPDLVAETPAPAVAAPAKITPTVSAAVPPAVPTGMTVQSSAMTRGQRRTEGMARLRGGASVDEVVADLGVPERTVYRWQAALAGELVGASA
jgi:hypothetical protein